MKKTIILSAMMLISSRVNAMQPELPRAEERYQRGFSMEEDYYQLTSSQPINQQTLESFCKSVQEADLGYKEACSYEKETQRPLTASFCSSVMAFSFNFIETIIAVHSGCRARIILNYANSILPLIAPSILSLMPYLGEFLKGLLPSIATGCSVCACVGNLATLLLRGDDINQGSRVD
jgi:hypothetical protein